MSNAAPDRVALWCLRGTTFAVQAQTPFGLDGYTAAMQLRVAASDVNPVLTLTSGDGLTLTTVTTTLGTVDVSIDPETTDGIAAGTYQFDLLLKNADGVIIVAIIGTIEFADNITHRSSIP